KELHDSSSILFNFFLKNLDSHLSFFGYRMMSSGCEDSSVNTMGIRGIPEQCGCGRRTGIYTPKTKENPGRSFLDAQCFEIGFSGGVSFLSCVDHEKIATRNGLSLNCDMSCVDHRTIFSTLLSVMLVKIGELPIVMLELVMSELVRIELGRIELVTLQNVVPVSYK
ncbi:hypothetical protein HID58_062059, partial [Brassica napus]